VSDHTNRSSVPRQPKECSSIAEALGDGFNILLAGGAEGCTHRTVTPARGLFALFNLKGWATDWASAKKHMKCSQCGHKNFMIYATVDIPGYGEKPIGPQSD
jgi:hypothetical protein